MNHFATRVRRALAVVGLVGGLAGCVTLSDTAAGAFEPAEPPHGGDWSFVAAGPFVPEDGSSLEAYRPHTGAHRYYAGSGPDGGVRQYDPAELGSTGFGGFAVVEREGELPRPGVGRDGARGRFEPLGELP